MNFLIIGGFLGSGKTSFLLQLINHMKADLGIEKIVILENEIGKVGIDDQVLRSAGFNVKGMFAGCVCCTMAGELPMTVKAIDDEYSPDWIIMETTGMAFPQNVQSTLQDGLEMDSRICCLTDAKRWPRLLNAMEHLLPLQLDKADVILINKTDLVDADTLESVRKSVTGYNGTAEIYPVVASEVIDTAVLDRVLGIGERHV